MFPMSSLVVLKKKFGEKNKLTPPNLKSGFLDKTLDTIQKKNQKSALFPKETTHRHIKVPDFVLHFQPLFCSGFTPLYGAALTGRVEVVDILLQHKADPSKGPDGMIIAYCTIFNIRCLSTRGLGSSYKLFFLTIFLTISNLSLCVQSLWGEMLSARAGWNLYSTTRMNQ